MNEMNEIDPARTAALAKLIGEAVRTHYLEAGARDRCRTLEVLNALAMATAATLLGTHLDPEAEEYFRRALSIYISHDIGCEAPGQPT